MHSFAPKKKIALCPNERILELVIKTLHGLEDCLADEIDELGGQKIKKLRRAVS